MSPPIHVVHVLHSMGTGGLEKGVTTLVTRASPGFRHSVLCLATSGPMAANLPPETPVVEMRKAPGNSARFLWRLARQLKAVAPDVIHTRNWGGMDGVIAARLIGHRGVVHGEHGWEMADATGQSRRRRRVRKLLSRWVTEFTCVSRDGESWLRGIGIRRPITQIYNGVDTDRYRPEPSSSPFRATLGIPPESLLVGFVGRLDPIKDHPTAFRAIAALRAGGRDAHLLVVGTGPEQGRLTALGFEGVHFLGDRADVPSLLRALDVFLLTSINEGISNTILEAMATALPIVATRVGGNPELVLDGSCGMLVDVGDDRAITRTLAAYAQNPDLKRRHGNAARGRALEHFSVRRMVDGYERVWTRVAQASRTG